MYGNTCKVSARRLNVECDDPEPETLNGMEARADGFLSPGRARDWQHRQAGSTDRRPHCPDRRSCERADKISRRHVGTWLVFGVNLIAMRKWCLGSVAHFEGCGVPLIDPWQGP